MATPRLQIDLKKIHHNARRLVEHLGSKGVTVTGVTKGALGSPDIATAMLRAGVESIGDSRIENIQKMRDGFLAKQEAPPNWRGSEFPSELRGVACGDDIARCGKSVSARGGRLKCALAKVLSNREREI